MCWGNYKLYDANTGNNKSHTKVSNIQIIKCWFVMFLLTDEYLHC